MVLLLALAFGTVSCREKELIADDIDIPGLGGTEEVQNDLDKWLKKNFTDTYNIEVIYRFDAAQMYTTLASKLTPVQLGQVQQMMAAIRDVWFEPYIKAAGDTFIKQMAPKKVVLVGSPEFSSGAIKLGQAEGGNKILLLNVNDFNASDADKLKTALHTILHEFGHILHQSKMFDKTYQDISVGLYDPSGWKEFDRGQELYYQPQSWALGFICNYAMNCKDDDFVDMLSMILVYGKKWFDDTVCVAAKKSTEVDDAYGDFQQKLSIIEDYLKNSWNIQLFDGDGRLGLESYVQQAVDRVVENPPKI